MKRFVYRLRVRLAAGAPAAAARRVLRVLFDSSALARASGRRHVVVLGDSHSRALRAWPRARWWFDVTVVEGATATGIRNADSETGALPAFRARLAQRQPWQPVLVLLGEVDCGYVIFKRAQARGESPERSRDETLARYAEFLRAEVGGEVLVMSVPLPTLGDDIGRWHGWVAQRRGDLTVPQAERTAMTLAFNAGLRDICEREGWTYLDATSAQLDAATGLIDPALMRPSGDHHLRTGPLRRLVARALDGVAAA